MTPFEKWLLLLSAAGTALTGAVYAWMRYLLEPVEPWAVIHHPLEPWVLKAHILVAPLLVFAVGMIAVSHVWKHFRSGARSGRRTGVLGMGMFVPMVVSGYLVQALTQPSLLLATVVLHVATGTLFAVGLALHFREFLRRRSLRPEAEAAAGAERPAETPLRCQVTAPASRIRSARTA